MSVNIIRSIVLVMIVLVLSCEEYLLKEEIKGCITDSACNYNEEATVDDGSCIAPQGCNKWCDGDTTTIADFDCAGECGGTLVEDVCGNCGGDCVADENEFVSCSAGNEKNNINADACGECGGIGVIQTCGCGNPSQFGIPDGDCDCNGSVVDCIGECGGTALYDNCGVCDADTSNDNTPLTGTCDCYATPEGEATVDGCGDCVGGTTGLNPCFTDCEGVHDGTSFYDNCSVCVPEGNTSCVQGCDGIWKNDGTQLIVDECELCGGNNSTCIDCAGTPNGSANVDNCEECVSAGDTSCVQGCDGIWKNDGTQLIVDECNVCGGDNTVCAGCDGIPNSGLEIDECGECGGSEDVYAECSGYGCMTDTACNYNVVATLNCNDCCIFESDCHGVCGGSAVIDSCGECGGGGPETNHDCNGICTVSTDCAEVCGGSAVIDSCGECGGNNDCFACNAWYMDNFICDQASAAGKCCVEDPNNSANKCKLLVSDGANCDVSSNYCKIGYEMECDAEGEFCDYDVAVIGSPCSTVSGSFTEGAGKCKKKCTGILCNDIACESPYGYCNYSGAIIGSPCSTISGSFTEGVGECILNISNDTFAKTGYITYYNTGCEDGTDDCCTEPACNEPFTLSLEYIDASTIQVNYSSTESIGGFQFELDGATSTGGSAGDAAINNLLVIATGGSIVLSYDQGGGFIPAGSGILTNLNITIDSGTENLCLKNIVVSDPSATAINTCPQYWQLSCIDVP